MDWPPVSDDNPCRRPHTIHWHRAISTAATALLVRITHWINVIALTALLMSGLQIFNEHPALYWGKSLLHRQARHFRGAERVPVRANPPTPASPPSSKLANKFPSWITVPSGQWLAQWERRWHFFFAWLFVINGMRVSRAQHREPPRAA